VVERERKKVLTEMRRSVCVCVLANIGERERECVCVCVNVCFNKDVSERKSERDVKNLQYFEILSPATHKASSYVLK
jgi:hypothetical protein